MYTFYRLSTKLQKGNVFNHVCLSFCIRGGPVTITHDAFGLTVQVPPPAPPLWTLDHTGQGPSPPACYQYPNKFQNLYVVLMSVDNSL